MKLLSKALDALKLINVRLARKPRPIFVMLNITNRCNLRCTYCFSKFYERQEPELSTEEVFSLVEQLADSGTKKIAISGGEPLLRPDLPQIIKFIQEKNIDCSFNSNGVLMPEKIESIKTVSSICISLDGPEEIHDYYRGSGSWQKAMAAIKIIKEYGIPLHISAVITKNNYGYLDYIFEFSKKQGALLSIAPLYNQIYGEKDGKFPEQFSNEEYRQVVKKIIDYKNKNYPILFSKKNYLTLLKWPDYQKDRVVGQAPNFPHVKCLAGKYMCSIEANGDVYPCGYFVGHLALNFKAHGFKKAFANINRHNCHACSWACYNELNLLLGLNPAAILNQFRNSLFERRHADLKMIKDNFYGKD